MLHFLWSPFFANVVSLLTIISLAFFIAEYKAVALRPISLLNSDLIIRYGLNNPFIVPVNTIKDISLIDNEKEVEASSKNIIHYNYFGEPNALIELKQSIKGIDKIYLSVDSPNKFISDLGNLKTTSKLGH